MDAGNGTHLLAKARAWFMLYHLQFYPTETSYISGLWENELTRTMKEYPPDPYIDITFFHSQTLADELKRNAETLSENTNLSELKPLFSAPLCGSLHTSHHLLDDLFYLLHRQQLLR